MPDGLCITHALVNKLLLSHCYETIYKKIKAAVNYVLVGVLKLNYLPLHGGADLVPNTFLYLHVLLHLFRTLGFQLINDQPQFLAHTSYTLLVYDVLLISE